MAVNGRSGRRIRGRLRFNLNESLRRRRAVCLPKKLRPLRVACRYTVSARNPEGAEDATIERFDVQRSQARRQVSAALNAMAEGHVRQHEIPGSQFRNVKVSVVVEGLITHRLSLPAYVLAYRYKDQLYRVVICGQNTRYLIGNAPYSPMKVFVVIFLTIVILLIGIGLAAG